MTEPTKPSSSGETLNVLCQSTKDGYILHAGPGWLPPTLEPFFDQNLESDLVLFLDFDDLDEFAQSRGAQIDKHPSKDGSLELTAKGESARSLAHWLGTSLASGLRPSSKT